MSRRTGFAVVLAVVLVAGLAWAQSTASRTVRAPSVLAEGMSAEEMTEEAGRLLEEMRGFLNDGFEKLQEAREDGDVQSIGCVNEGLTAIKGLVRLGDRSYTSLREAAARGESHTAQHEFVKLSLASSKVGEMRTQLMACGGPEFSTETEGEAELQVLSDKDMPVSGESVSIWYSGTDVVMMTPVAASPFF